MHKVVYTGEQLLPIQMPYCNCNTIYYVAHPNVIKNTTVNTRHTIDIATPIYVTTDKARASASLITYN